MGFQANVYCIMIASPSDVKEEREIAREVVIAWTIDHAEKEEKVLLPLLWERDSIPGVGRAQEIINEQLLDKSDIVIVIFWHKLGTATGKSASGTAEERERAIEQGKQVLAYFSKRDIPHDHDPKQVAELREFQEQLKSKVKYEEFTDKHDFKDKLSRHLNKTVFSPKYRGLSHLDTSDDDEADAGPELSDPAKIILKWGVKDEKGNVTCARPYGVLCGNTYMGKGTKDSAPEREIWFAAVKELLNRGLLRMLDNPDSFVVNAAGYKKAAELVKNEPTLKDKYGISEDAVELLIALSRGPDRMIMATDATKDDVFNVGGRNLIENPGEKVRWLKALHELLDAGHIIQLIPGESLSRRISDSGSRLAVKILAEGYKPKLPLPEQRKLSDEAKELLIRISRDLDGTIAIVDNGNRGDIILGNMHILSASATRAEFLKVQGQVYELLSMHLLQKKSKSSGIFQISPNGANHVAQFEKEKKIKEAAP